MVFWLGKLFICLITSLFGFYACLEIEYFSSVVSDPLVPLLVIMALSFLLGNVIMTLVGTISDTLIFIYLLDEEIENIHYNEKNPRNAPIELTEFMQETLQEIQNKKI